MLDKAIKLEALKGFVFDYIEENETIESIKETANETGMIVLIGVPLIIILTVVAIVLTCCCAKRPKF
jgi:CHASE3 domain sensor protein